MASPEKEKEAPATATSTPTPASATSNAKDKAVEDAPEPAAGLFEPEAESVAEKAKNDDIAMEWAVSKFPDGHYADMLEHTRSLVLEGHGECICKIGVDRAGHPVGIPDAEFDESLEMINKISAELHCASAVIIDKTVKETPRYRCAEVLIRKMDDDTYIDMRIAICGNVDSGKSTFVGVCTKGVLDNGRGLIRSKVFKHKHEQETGRTSAISEQLIGFSAFGDVVNYSELQAADEKTEKVPRQTVSTKDLSERSAKILTFYDLAGHEKYLKTTVLGMTGSMPDYACLVISANNGIQRMTKEHLGLCLALKIPFFTVITRIDMCPPEVAKNTTETIVKILKSSGVNKLPFIIRKKEDVVIAAKNMKEDRLAPIFHISNVTGENMDLVRKFLNLLPIRKDWASLAQLPLEVVIDSTFYVQGVGTVVGGIVTQGSVAPNDTILLGPNSNGHFRQAVVKSIHVKQLAVDRVSAGTAACFALKKERRADIRKGMVMLERTSKPAAVWEFEAEIVVLYHSTTIQSNYQPVLHCGTVRQSCTITLSESTELLRTGDKARVKFKFMYKPEYVKVGSKIIFREGRTKGLGTISSISSTTSAATSASATTSASS
eukprot:NODE_933_length_1983_cov_100.448925_g885_i0.p1 GENE.NODE_933_length_1983_cov_100.448925_g885_i0~~NODE_933_length_1983_cov_100.448925_g885_i0.p1  ORF type:complete len:605 (-),score=123.95 NODE_933_length_1983_cov_100.448925_g885_i0:97-1911(-)